MPLQYKLLFMPDPPYGTFVVRFWDPATRGGPKGARIDTRRKVPAAYWQKLGHPIPTPANYKAGERKSENIRDLAAAWAARECERLEVQLRGRASRATGREAGLDGTLEWYISRNPNGGVAGTIAKYRDCRKRLVAHFGVQRWPSTIDADAIIGYRNAMQQRKPPLRNSTIKDDVVFLKQAITYTYETRDSHENPCNVREIRLLKLPRRWLTKQKSLRRSLSQDELARIIRVRLPRDGTRIVGMIIFAFTTGTRRWPLLNHERAWRDLDRKLQRIPGWAMKGGEHRWSDHDFEAPLCQWAIDATASSAARYSKWTWPNPRTGQPNTQVDRSLHEIAALAGVARFSLQDLRKTFASILSSNGVHELEISILMGHASSSVTREYITQHPDALRKAVAVFDRLRERLDQTPANVVRMR